MVHSIYSFQDGKKKTIRINIGQGLDIRMYTIINSDTILTF